MEGTTLERLQVVIEAKTKPYTDAMNKIRDKTKAATDRINNNTKGINRALNSINGTSATRQVEALTNKLNRQHEAISKQSAAVENLRAKLDGLAQTEIGQLEGKLNKQTEAVSKQQIVVDQLKAKYDALSSGDVSNKGLSAMERDLSKAEKEFSKVDSEMQKLLDKLNDLSALEDIGLKAHGIDEVKAQIDALNPKYEELESKTESLRQKLQEAKLNPQSTAEAAKLKAELDLALQKLERLNQEKIKTDGQVGNIKADPGNAKGAGETNEAIEQATAKIERLKNEAEQTQSKIKQVLNSGGSALGNSVKHITGFFDKAKNAAGRFGKQLTSGKREAGGFGGKLEALQKRITRLVAAVFVFNLMRKALKGFQDYLGGALNSNKQFTDSLNQIKANLKVAFAPIYEAILPAINSLMSAMAKLSGYMATALNAVFGKTYAQGLATAKGIDKAIDKSKDKSDKAAKEAQNTLGIDELNVLNDNSGADGGGGDSGLDISEMEKTASLGEEIKNIFANIFKPMQDSWNNEGLNVINSAKSAFSNILELGKSIGKSFMDVWTNGSGKEFCTNILLLIRQMFDLVSDFAYAFKNAWEDDGRGTALIQSYFDVWNAVMSLLYTIGESFREVWNNGTGEAIIANVLEIFTNIYNIITNISDSFKSAWNDNGNGTKIIQDIADMANGLLGSINNITSGLASWTKDLDFGPFLKSFHNITDALKPLSDKLGAGLEWLFTNVLEPLAKWAMEQAIPAVMDGIAAALEFLNSVLDVLRPGFHWVWENLLKPLAKWTGGAIVDIINGITSVFKGLTNIFKEISNGTDWSTIGKYLWEGLIGGIIALKDWVWTKIKDVFGIIIDAVKDLFGIHSPSTVFAELGIFLIEGLFKGISDTIGKVIDFFSGVWTNIQDVFSNAGGWFKDKFEKAKDGVTNAFSNVGNWFGQRYADVKAAVKDAPTMFKDTFSSAYSKVSDVFSPIGAWFNGKYEEVKGAFAESPSWFSSTFTAAYSNTQSAMSSIGTWFGEKYSNVKEAFSNAPTWFHDTFTDAYSKITSVFDPVKQFFSDIGDSIMSSFKNSINGVITLFNKFIDWVNEKLHISFDGLEVGGIEIMPSFDVQLFKIPKIPQLAQGGLINSGQLFIANEAGSELIGKYGNKTGVMNNDQIVKSVSSAVYAAVVSALSSVQGNNKSNPIEIKLMVDGRTLAKVVTDANKRNGVSFNPV